MSITVVQDQGVTLITMETDRTSMLPPLCQVLRALCCRSVSCSLFKRAEGLRQSRTVSALGTLQIMVGLFNIGLGPGRIGPSAFMSLGAAYWLGAVFMLSGIVSLLANRFPCPFSVGSAVLMNITGFVFTVIGVRLYATDILAVLYTGFCYEDRAQTNEDRCEYVAQFFRVVVIGMDITMIILTVLQLLVCVTLTVQGVSALCGVRRKEEATDDEIHQPEMKEALLTEPDSPPCQILKPLCSGMRADRPMPYNTTAVLGTIQIMVGLFNIGLGPGRISLHPGDFADLGVAYWLGSFILAGGFSLCAAWNDGRWLVGSTVAVNILGCVLAIIGCWLYGADVLDYSYTNFCDGSHDDCQTVASFLKSLVQCMDVTMIVLGVATLVVCIIVTAFGIRDLISLRKKKEATDDKIHQPEKEALLTQPDA